MHLHELLQVFCLLHMLVMKTTSLQCNVRHLNKILFQQFSEVMKKLTCMLAVDDHVVDSIQKNAGLNLLISLCYV